MPGWQFGPVQDLLQLGAHNLMWSMATIEKDNSPEIAQLKIFK